MTSAQQVASAQQVTSAEQVASRARQVGSTAPSPRCAHVCIVYSESLFVFGGYDGRHYFDCTRDSNGTGCFDSFFPAGSSGAECQCLVKDCVSTSRLLVPQRSACVVPCRDPAGVAVYCANRTSTAKDYGGAACSYYSRFVCVATHAACSAAMLPPTTKHEAACLAASAPPSPPLPLGIKDGDDDGRPSAIVDRLAKFLDCMGSPPPRRQETSEAAL